MNRHSLVSCSPTCSAMSATGWLFAGSTTIASDRSVNPLPGRAHGTVTVLTPCSGHATRGTEAWMNALYWKKFR